MHELGVLLQTVKTVARIAEENGIEKVDHLTLEVGDESGYLPVFFEKLYPVATEKIPSMAESRLKIVSAPGKGLSIKDIGYHK